MVDLTYNTALFTSVVLVGDTLESNKVSTCTSTNGIDMLSTVQYIDDQSVTDFLTGSSDTIFRFKLTTSYA